MACQKWRSFGISEVAINWRARSGDRVTGRVQRRIGVPESCDGLAMSVAIRLQANVDSKLAGRVWRQQVGGRGWAQDGTLSEIERKDT